jgi:predicted AAA+ superfamily ATPase
MNYIPRDISNEILYSCKHYPVITITGPRQSGKTTLARNLFTNIPYFSFENPDIRSFAANDPRAFLDQCEQGAIFDEIHQIPVLIEYLQQIVDDKKKKVTFILTGSNQFSIMNRVTQSLAGRTAVLKLLPLSLKELKQSANLDTNKLIYQGFYPGIVAENLNPTKAYRNYYETYLERDLRQLILVKDLHLFQKFIRLCAGRIGNLFNASSISSEVGISVPTVKSWISVLEASYIATLVYPYHPNVNKRFIKSPKLYFYDVGLASYLMGIEKGDHINTYPLRGALFENMVLMELIKFRYNQGLDPNIFFYRDSQHHEIDFILNWGKRLLFLEIKSSKTFHSDFLKAFEYFPAIKGNRKKTLLLAYDGSHEQKIGDIDVINFRNITDYLE